MLWDDVADQRDSSRAEELRGGGGQEHDRVDGSQLDLQRWVKSPHDASRAQEPGDEDGPRGIGRDEHAALVRSIDEHTGQRPDHQGRNGDRDEHT